MHAYITFTLINVSIRPWTSADVALVVASSTLEPHLTTSKTDKGDTKTVTRK